MKIGVYTDISVPVYMEVEAETMEEAIKIAEEKSRDSLNQITVIDETLGYCLMGDDVENLTDDEFQVKYGVPKYMRY